MCLGIPGRITEVWQEDEAPMARADFGGAVRRVCLAYLPGLAVGDFVLTHMGYALTKISEAEATATLTVMREHGVLGAPAGEPHARSGATAPVVSTQPADSGHAMTADATASAISPDLPGGGPAEDLAAAALALARRFHAGATLWCVAPARPPHAHRMAAEFAHPVSAGKRALPAFALTGPGLVAQARVAVRPGDILIAVATAHDQVVADLMRRAPAWGALSAWIGSGERPPGGAADHVLWLADPDPARPAADRFVPLWHLLWELTQACFEHPESLAPPPECAAEGCVTCGDEGRLAEVIAPPASLFDKALVRTATGRESVDVTLVAPVSAGDLVLVHAGAALARPGPLVPGGESS